MFDFFFDFFLLVRSKIYAGCTARKEGRHPTPQKLPDGAVGRSARRETTEMAVSHDGQGRSPKIV